MAKVKHSWRWSGRKKIKGRCVGIDENSQKMRIVKVAALWGWSWQFLEGIEELRRIVGDDFQVWREEGGTQKG